MRNFVLTVVLPLLVTGNLWSQSTKLPARPDSGWVHDSTGTLSQSSIDRLNALCDRVAQSAGQLAVAVVPTTGGEVPRTYATRLFNNWGIGNADKDNGVLIFVAINDRKAEIVLGDGIDDEQHESRARDIMSDYMIPVFKRGQPEEAVLVAADETARQLFRMELPLENVSLAAPNRPLANQPPLVDQPPFVQPPRRRRPRSMVPWIVGGLAGATGLGISGLLVRRWRRFGVKTCPSCRIPMNRLMELEEDPHLSESESLEEELKSVDYDVWSCPSCPHVLKLQYPAWFSSYAKCPQCQTRTKSSTVSTIQAATEYSQGLEEIYEQCVHCNYSHTFTRSTPMLASTTSSSSFGSGGSSGGGGFGGGSSSGGGGFGGGSSSGGGASGSW